MLICEYDRSKDFSLCELPEAAAVPNQFELPNAEAPFAAASALLAIRAAMLSSSALRQ
jgi:hypothetical protein